MYGDQMTSSEPLLVSRTRNKAHSYFSKEQFITSSDSVVISVDNDDAGVDFGERIDSPSDPLAGTGKNEVADDLDAPISDDAAVLVRLQDKFKYSDEDADTERKHPPSVPVPTHELRPKCSKCAKLCGQPNAFDLEFVKSVRDKLQQESENFRMRFWFTRDCVYKPTLGLPLENFCTKRLFVFRPDLQFAGKQMMLPCPSCNARHLFTHKDYHNPRYAHTLDGGVLVLVSRLACQNCKKRVSSIHPAFLASESLWHSLFPFYFTNQSGFHQDFLSLYLNLWTSGTSIASLVKCISRARHTYYLRCRLQFYEGLASVAFNVLTGKHVIRQAFPAMGRHCDGYNEILSPSENLLQDALCAYAKHMAIPSYTGRFLGATTAIAVCSDQHHVVPKRVVYYDAKTRRKVRPYPGIHAAVNERSQVLLYYWTMSSATAELRHLSVNLAQRLASNPPKIWTTDRCCLGVCDLVCEADCVRALMTELYCLYVNSTRCCRTISGSRKPFLPQSHSVTGFTSLSGSTRLETNNVDTGTTFCVSSTWLSTVLSNRKMSNRALLQSAAKCGKAYQRSLMIGTRWRIVWRSVLRFSRLWTTTRSIFLTACLSRLISFRGFKTERVIFIC
jgi:hypothetical protein